MVVYLYLKYFPDYIDSKYIWVHGSNSLGSSVFAEIQFLAFLDFHKGKEMCKVLPSPCYSWNEVVYVYQALDL